MHPLVSVILPNYNHAPYIKESIEAILGQSYGDLELIIVDDFSSDNSREIIEMFRRSDKRVLSSYNSKNLGVSYARNRAIEKSAGKYIAFCDSDDIWHKSKLGIQIESLETRKEYDVTFCDSMIIDGHGAESGNTFSSKHGRVGNIEGNLFRELCETNFICNSTVLLRKSCIEKVGLLNEGLRYDEDWFYWICLARHFKFLFIDLILAKYRVHSWSTYTNINKVGYSKARIVTCRMVIDSFSDLPNEIRSSLYYKIAHEYTHLGERKSACDNYVRGYYRSWWIGNEKGHTLRLLSNPTGYRRRNVCPGRRVRQLRRWVQRLTRSKALSNGSPEKGRGSCSKQLLKRKSRST